MLIWIIQTSIISIIFIFLVHHLFCYLKDILTIPKVKDLVNSNKKYQDIYTSLTNNNNNNNNNIPVYNDNNSDNNLYTEIDLLPNNITNNSHSNNSMKDELKSFLKTQLNSDSVNNNDTDFENFSYL